jgi:PAS domain S-box-containing protein
LGNLSATQTWAIRRRAISNTLDGVITSWNRAAEQAYGSTAGEVIGRSISLPIPQDRDNEMPGIIDRIRRGERVGHYDRRG